MKQSYAMLKLDHSMILLLFVHFLSAQLNYDPAHKHFEHALALAKNSATYIFTKMSKKPVAHYQNDHSDGLENMRFLLIHDFEVRKHPEMGLLPIIYPTLSTLGQWLDRRVKIPV